MPGSSIAWTMLEAWRLRRASASRSRSPAARSRSPTRARSTSPRPGSPSSRSCATTSPWPRARCAARAAGRTCWCATPNGIHGEFFYQKRAPDVAAGLDRGRRAPLPLGPHGRGGRAARRRGAGLDGEPRLPRAAPASGARRGPRPSRRAARRPRSGARRRVAADRGGRRASCARSLADLGLVGWPKTSGSRGIHVNVRIHRALVVHAGAARRARAGARGRAARARRSPPASGGRRSATASSSTTTRTPRTARSPAPTRCAPSPTRASRRR